MESMLLSEFNPEDLKTPEELRQAIVMLLNLVSDLQQENLKQKAEIQRLRDENNRLKGEQGKPKIKGNKRASTDHSSETERKKQPKPKPKRKKRRPHQEVKIDREETLVIPEERLPADAIRKGYEEVVVQDVELKTNNVLYHKEKWYSPSEKRTYLAELPEGYQGQFGPTVKSLVLTLYYSGRMSESKIIEFVEQIGVNLSAGTVSNWLSQDTERWEEEADKILKAGLASTPFHHIDDTSTRVDGVNHYCHILCNPFYTAYATRRYKNRLTVVSVLQNREESVYLFNEEADNCLTAFGVPKWAQKQVAGWPRQRLLTEAEVTELLTGALSERLNDQQLARIREAGALSAYHTQDEYPIIPILVSDDAPQFRHLTAKQMLCWVHEGRHYKKLTPYVAYHRQILDTFLSEFWTYYHELNQYRADPTTERAEWLDKRFDEIFGQKTDYEQLNARLAQTRAHKEQLLVVLADPVVPLHNNSAELGARQRVRKRDVSFGPRSQSGRIAWDVFMTVSETAKKLSVSFYDYVYDRVAEVNEMPTLADLIRSQFLPTASHLTLSPKI